MLKESRSAELKKQVCDMMKNGKRLTQCEARKIFSQYLGCVLKRISTSSDQEGHVEIVVKFLEKTSAYLRTPLPIKVSSFNLQAVARRQIDHSRYIFIYNINTG